MAKALVLDPTKCRGCFSCAIACSTVNFGVGDLGISRITVTPFFSEAFFVPMACFQCETPYCCLVCPTKALKKNHDNGLVEFNKAKCIGCRICVMVCPFGNITLVNHYPSKCDLCGGDPTSVKVCEWEALGFVEVERIADGRRTLMSEAVLECQRELLRALKVQSKSEKGRSK